jgi:ribosomal peptide maturation radical SAM protein 1
MPWGSVLKPSLALALLKHSIKKAGYSPDLHYLNIAFAQRLGLRLYEHIAERSFLHPEWFFSQSLFGPSGLAEIRNSWQDLLQQPGALELVEMLREMTGGSDETCRTIAQEHVPSFISDSLQHVDWGQYMAVGFTTTFAQSLSSLLLARHIKEKHPHIKIIFGGASVDSEMGVEFIKGFPWVDYVVHGEAENSFPQLLKNIDHGCTEEVPGVSMRRGEEIFRGDLDCRPLADMNDSPFPDYSDYIAALEQAGFRRKMELRLYFESSRGCWWGQKHQCSFCGLNGSSIEYRRKEPDRVFQEIKHLAEAYHCLTLSATDNIFAQEYFSHLLPQLREMDIDLNLFYEVKANLKRKQLTMLHDAGVLDIQPGIESFNSRILELANKGVTAIQNIQLLKWCHEIGITPIYNVLYGFPGETRQDYEGLPRIFRQLAHLQPPANLQQVLFERFSPYYLDPGRFALALTPLELYQFIFPGSRVCLDKVAYYFHGTQEGQHDDAQDYMQASLEAWQSWEKQWREQSTFCYYEKGPNFLTIHDNRPGDFPSAACRTIHLDERVSAVYLFCDEAHSLKAILEMMRARFGLGQSESDVQLWLDQLLKQDLMFCEQDRYLSLAVRTRPRRYASPLASEQATFQNLLISQ